MVNLVNPSICSRDLCSFEANSFSLLKRTFCSSVLKSKEWRGLYSVVQSPKSSIYFSHRYFSTDSERKDTRIPFSRMRLRIAERLKSAQNTAASLTTFNECDMTALLDFRQRYNEENQNIYSSKLGIVSAFLMASTLALQKMPSMNAYIDGNEIVQKNYVDISVAVATPKGLVVPVIRDCHKKSWQELEKDLISLATKARNNQISLSEMNGGTFTISNGGIYGSMLGTPILNPPQASILGIHSTMKRPVVRNDEIVIRSIMYLALTYDHRMIDGREAVLFLAEISKYIEDPSRMLLKL